MLTDKICCNCRLYVGVNGVQGCAPCIHQKKTVLWDDSCEDFLLTGKRLFVGSPTNADRIRAMSDAELAEFLRDVAWKEKYSYRGVLDKAEIAGGKITPWLEWLEEEDSE